MIVSVYTRHNVVATKQRVPMGNYYSNYSDNSTFRVYTLYNFSDFYDDHGWFNRRLWCLHYVTSILNEYRPLSLHKLSIAWVTNRINYDSFRKFTSTKFSIIIITVINNSMYLVLSKLFVYCNSCMN